jgi:hypothetical protein
MGFCRFKQFYRVVSNIGGITNVYLKKEENVNHMINNKLKIAYYHYNVFARGNRTKQRAFACVTHDVM